MKPVIRHWNRLIHAFRSFDLAQREAFSVVQASPPALPVDYQRPAYLRRGRQTAAS